MARNSDEIAVSSPDPEIPQHDVTQQLPIAAAPSGGAVPGFLLVAWLVIAVPMFLRMPETNDAEMFDLQAWLVSDGGVLYRDVLEPNLPGVVWIHLIVRAVAGSSSEALRAFDLLTFAVLMSLVFRLLKMAGGLAGSAMWTVLACSMFYLGTSEWCHCQRDMWMLTPAMAGVWMRLRQRERAESECSRGKLALWSLAEGLVWGVGIWIKPYVLLVTIAVWLCTLSRAVGLRRAMSDSLGLLAGGAVAGGAGFAWLAATGAWPYLLDTLLNWNPRYLEAGRENWDFPRFRSMVIRFSPWIGLHLVAVPISLKRIGNRFSADTDLPDPRCDRVSFVLATVYLVWLGQAFLLQHLFDYVHAPGIVLAVVVCAQAIAGAQNKSIGRSLAMLSGVLVVATTPYLQLRTLPVWKACVSAEASPEVQDQLTHFDNPRRTDLQTVSKFLKQQDVRDKDVLVFNSDAVSLYRRLNLQPPSRYAYFFETLMFFPDKQREIIREAMSSRPRFIVVDLVSSLQMNGEEARAVGPDGEKAPPPKYRPRNSFPWRYSVAFRSGSWLILKVPAGGVNADPNQGRAQPTSL